MSNMPRIVDATSEPIAPPAAPTGGQTMPVKIDTSQMQAMLQNLVGKQMQSAANGVQTTAQAERVNPSVYIKSLSDEMEQLYARFDRLKKLAVELHGRQTDAPIPEHVKVKKITIDFALIKDGKEEPHTADVQHITTVGEISNLLSTEFGFIILSLTEKAKQLQEIAQKTGDRCSSALSEWEKNNKDKKIIRGDEATTVSTATDELPATSAPVTLEAS